MADEQLASWVDGTTKSAIVDFVERVTTEGGPDYVDRPPRVAVLDNDGTLVVREADADPARLHRPSARRAWPRTTQPLRDQQPYKAAYEQDLHWLGAAMVKHYHGDDGDLKLLMGAVTRAFDAVTVEEYDARVDGVLRGHRPPDARAVLPRLRLRADGRAARLPRAPTASRPTSPQVATVTSCGRSPATCTASRRSA